MEKRDVNTKTYAMKIEEAQTERREKRAQALKVRRRKVKVAKKADSEKARRSFITGRRLILISVTVAVAFFVGSSAFRIMDLKTQEEKAAELLKVKTEQKARLESELLMLKDKEYIEEQARERLGMVKPGEVVYVFEDEDAKNGANKAGSKSDAGKADAENDADAESGADKADAGGGADKADAESDADDEDATGDEVVAADIGDSDSGE
ncbi:MAG: septum formation initiator family protein [Clostridiales Family XIII bacterium]|jgi:cell division protein FtsB|nr:septum formation initiator family protein [Clostridiales Family XIII bacterium]